MINAITGLFAGKSEPKIQYSCFEHKTSLFGGDTTTISQKEISADEYLKRANKEINYDPNEKELKPEVKDAIKTLMPVSRLFTANDEFGITYNQDTINEVMFQKADSDGNGTVDDKELIDLYSSLATANGTKNDKKAVIVAGVINTVTSLLNNNNEYTEEQLEQINNFYNQDKGLDVNQDGVIDREEFNGAAINYILTPENNPNNKKEEE